MMNNMTMDETSTAARAYKAELEELEADTRKHALRRVEQLLEQGYQEPRAMRMAITLANEWADNGKTTDSALPGPSQHVMYEQGHGWVICTDQGERATNAYARFEDALRRAHQLATKHHSAIYIYGLDDRLIDKYEHYGSDIKNGYHVMPWQNGWVLKLTGEEGDFERFDSKREALEAARLRARADHSMLVVHYQDGRVQRTSDYRPN